ncbi:MAG: hypothetical protein ACO3CH_00630 [Ilumatobacteraceae bacterium]
MRSPNRLTEAQTKITSINDANSWTATNLSINNEGISTFRPGGYRQLSLSIIDDNLPNSLTLSSAQANLDDLEKQMSFFFAVRMVSGGSVTVTVNENVYGNVSVEETIDITSNTNVYSVANNFGSTVQTFDWTIVRIPPFTASGSGLAPSFEISIEFEPADPTEIFYFSSPVLIGYLDMLYLNSVLISLMQRVPEWIFNKEIAIESLPNLQMIRYMDIGSDYLDKAFEYLYKFLYVDIASGFNPGIDATRSTLVDPKVADYQTLLWLVVFTFTSPVTRYELSPDYLPDPFILDESELDGTDRLLLTSFTSLNPPVISRETQIALLRWQAETGYYGGFAGTLPAVREAAKQMLTGAKTLTIDYDYEAEPWVINITSPWNETFGGDETLVGEPSNLVLEAVSYAKPLGVLINHEMTAAV